MANDSDEERTWRERIKALPLETRQRLRQKAGARWDKEAASKSGDAAGESKPDDPSVIT